MGYSTSLCKKMLQSRLVLINIFYQLFGQPTSISDADWTFTTKSTTKQTNLQSKEHKKPVET